MAYTIIRSDGTVLTTIQDGTINTTSTALGLPGRNFSGYGQALNTNFVRMLENFASASVPANPVRGQLWYDTSGTGVLRLCPADNTLSANSWLVLASTNNQGNTTLGNLTVTDDLFVGGNITAGKDIAGDTITVRLATVTANLSAANANINSANLSSVRTQTITTGSSTTAGSFTGILTITGNSSGNGLVMNQGNIAFSSGTFGIKSDNYMYANGAPFNPSGTYTNANVSDFLTGANSVTRFTGNIAPTQVTTTRLSCGGTIQGIWTLEANARIQATYADLAERYEADEVYEPGTVVEIGGEKEVTKVKEDLSDDVFGVVSNTAAYLMNATAGDDNTHPAIAVSGRVNVKVIGKVKKGQRLVSAGNGLARAASKEELTAFNTIGRALADKTTEDEGVVEAVVMIK
jgi:hypothetical protein